MTRKLKAVRNELELFGIDVERVARALRHHSCRSRQLVSRDDKFSGITIKTPLRRHATYAARLLFVES